MPRVNDMFPSKYLKAADLEDGDRAVTIKGIDKEKIGQGADAEWKHILYFEEEEKGLVLNKTNAGIIVKLYGDDTDDWEGKKVTLFATEVQFKQDMVDAIRIRSKTPKAPGGKTAKATVPAAREPGEDDDVDPAF